MKTSRLVASLAVALATMFVTNRAEAAFITYTDRGVWDTTVGPASFTVDFSGFATDVSFAEAVVNLGPFSLEGAAVNHPSSPYGDLSSIVNIIDASAANANFGINDFVGLFDHVDMTFGTPVTAWGAMINSIGGDETIGIDLFNGATLLATLQPNEGPLPPNVGTVGTAPYVGFFGFSATAGEQVTSLRFRAVPPGAGSLLFGDAFTIDDVVGVTSGTVTPVPEPSTLGLVTIGLAGMGAAVRRRRHNQ